MNWCAADVAVHLWMTARNQRPGVGSQAIRTMQIDAVKYMHMALPQDLTAAEIASLRETMPQDVLYQSAHSENTAGPNNLRKAVAQIVAWAMAITFFVSPLLLTLLNGLLKYERDHHLAERILANGINTVNGMGEYGAQLQTSLVRLRDGPMGRALVGTTVYVAEGIGGGLVDGYRDARVVPRGPFRQVACGPGGQR
jgi:hypothetical protein